MPKTKSYKKTKKTKTEVFKPLQVQDEEILKFLRKHCNQPSFQDGNWFVRAHQFNLIDPRKRLDYYPAQLKSAHFKVSLNGDFDSIDGKDWIQLDLFQVHVNPESGTLTGYIGSECYAMDWLPKPSAVVYTTCGNSVDTGSSNLDPTLMADYIVVASLGDGRGFDDYELPNLIEKTHVPPKRKGLIQLWKLESDKLECVCCFANDYGLIWAFEAPKGGTSYCPVNRRLSLIAAAFDDGYVRIFSIPFPQDLTSPSQTRNLNHLSTKLPSIYNLPPVAILEPPFTSHIVARCLSWSWCDQQQYIAVGYGNGMANYYNLASTSSILVRRDSEHSNATIFKPVKTWIAHGAIVSAIQILPLPESKTIVTGSWDRNIKLWNVRQPRLLPLPLLHRSVVHCLTASLHLPGGFFITMDDAFLASNQSVVTFKQIYEEGSRPAGENRSLYTLPFDTSNVYTLSLSLYFNSILISDNSGNSILQNNFRAKHEKTTRRKLSDLLPVFTSQLRRLVPTNFNEESANTDSQDIPVEEAKSTRPKMPNKKSSTSKESTSKQKKKASPKETKTTNGFLINKNERRVRSYEDISSQYGIIFNDYTLNTMEPQLVPIVNKFREASNLKRARLTDYPITAINKCVWSPNKETSNTLANLIHSGIIRISSLSKSFIGEQNASSCKVKEEEEEEAEEEEKESKPRGSTRRKRSLPSQ